MHTAIAVFVYAADKETAENNAMTVFDQLCENGSPFDWHQPVSRRWTGFADMAVPLYSPEGKHAVKTLMGFTRADFMEGLEGLKPFLERIAAAPQSLYHKEHEWPDFRYICSKLGQYRGDQIHLYDHEGEGIRTPKILGRVITKWASFYERHGQANPYQDLSVWIMARDVHF